MALGCAGSSRALPSPALWGEMCLKAVTPSWHPFFSLASELVPTHPDMGCVFCAHHPAPGDPMGWVGQPGTCLVPLSEACPRSSSPRCLHSALPWHLVPLWHKGSAVFSSPPASAAAWLPSVGFVGIPHQFPLPWDHQPGLSLPHVAIMMCSPYPHQKVAASVPVPAGNGSSRPA